MKVAKVIVDVPANQTDRAFDYLIPKELEEFAVTGMRVVVPFGPRKIQGFIVEISSSSELETLKEIEEFQDPIPVLTEELIELGFWLTKKTLCFAISAFQAMLPAVLKAKYEKKLRLVNEAEQQLANQEKLISWKEVEERKGLSYIYKELQRGNMEVIYKVEDKTTQKKERLVIMNGSEDEMVSYYESLPPQASKQKEILAFLQGVRKPVLIAELLEQMNTTAGPVQSLVKKGVLKIVEQEVYRDPYGNREFKKTDPFPLSKEQEKAIKPILSCIDEEKHSSFLLHGVTGSGKTEVYLQAIAEVLKKGKQAIMLVPEIALTPMMVTRFKGRFGKDVAVLHSGLSSGEKYDEWRRIQRQEVSVVVGARSAIFAPFNNIGIIIIDEEHETSYKQEETPRYHARDVAIFRGTHYKCPVVLGSATPALETFARAKKGVYHLLTLSSRMNQQALPAVERIDMREELRQGNRSMFSSTLFEKMKDRLEKGEQTVLFLNRRGFSTFVMCRNCGYTLQCPHCDISLTYHKKGNGMKCHYCGFDSELPKTCPECSSEHIRFFGTGTQKVEEELNKLLPEARVLRMDVDTTRKKGSHERILTLFEEKKGDILLGTQMIAKGLDFPEVTLVGILAADSMLHLADFRAAEKTFQLLTQVSGRAGRHHLPGEVIIQTYDPSHFSIELASQHDFEAFYFQEMQSRKRHKYPPFYFLTLISIAHQELMEAVAITEKIANQLTRSLSPEAVVLGPVSSPISRMKDRYRYQCMVKYKNEPNLGKTLQMIIDYYQKEVAKGKLVLSIDMNPYLLM